MSYKFQIDLSGIIELLSKHLYSTPQVYIRELLQNGVDAIRAYSHIKPDHEGEINLKITTGENNRPLVIFSDNGVGLTEDEIHRFLATIGQSSKRSLEDFSQSDFIGQFGIGLLSCFVVSDEIRVLTRSAKSNGQTIEWRGRSDGTYSVSFPAEEMPVGTKVFLHCKAGMEEYFADELVKNTALHYGGLLPFPIYFHSSDGEKLFMNKELPPWKKEFVSPHEEKEDFIRYGRELLGTDFLDYIRLESKIGEVQGVAFVLPFSPSLASKKTHRVYLKEMLLSENAEGLLPDWAFFVKSVVNVNGLRPTASRESFYEDESLLATRAALGSLLRSYLLNLAKSEPARLRKLISLHYLSIKALAVEDDDFFRLFIDWLPFETTVGWMSLGEYKQRNEAVRFISNRDQFRQISQVAVAQNVCIINSSYTYDAELIHKHYDLFREIPHEEVTLNSFTHSFAFLTLDEQDTVDEFLHKADSILKPFRCKTEMRRFAPPDLPVIYLTNEEANFRRSVEQSREVVDSLWSGVLDNLAAPFLDDDLAQVCFNFNNPLVGKIIRIQDENLLKTAIKTLYVQALLLGHRPLSPAEMRLLNEGLMSLLEFSIELEGGWIQ